MDTYFRVQEVDRNSQKEDEREQGEQLARILDTDIDRGFQLRTYHHVCCQIVPNVYHWYNTEGSACTKISAHVAGIRTTYLTK